MSFTTFLLAIACLWLFAALGACFVLGRRGHDPFTWGLLGAVLGPLVVPLAVVAIRNERNAGTARTPVHPKTSTDHSKSDAVDVLVGIDGSPQADAAFESVLRLLAGSIGRFAIATASPFGADSTTTGRQEAAQDLVLLESYGERAARALGRAAETVVLRGKAADALERYCQDQQFDLLVIGSRGAGLATTLLGSVTSRLASHSKVPVLIVPDSSADAGCPRPTSRLTTQPATRKAGESACADDVRQNAGRRRR